MNRFLTSHSLSSATVMPADGRKCSTRAWKTNWDVANGTYSRCRVVGLTLDVMISRQFSFSFLGQITNEDINYMCIYYINCVINHYVYCDEIGASRHRNVHSPPTPVGILTLGTSIHPVQRPGSEMTSIIYPTGISRSRS